MLLGDEPHRPYERPPLSKGYLQGSADRDTVYVHPPSGTPSTTSTCGSAPRSPASTAGPRAVTRPTASRLRYDKLLLATGSTPRRLPVPGADLDGVHYLRSLDDSDRLKAAFGRGARVVIIGAGWIGLETAAAARAAGAEVTVLEHGRAAAAARARATRSRQVFADLHRDHGVDLRCGVQVAAITARTADVDGVELADGTAIDADVVSSASASPRTSSSPSGRARRRQRHPRRRSICAPPTRTSTPPATSPTPTTRCWAGSSASSTGPTRCTSRPSPRRRCSARTPPTTGCRTSSPTSTTSAWSTPATPTRTVRPGRLPRRPGRPGVHRVLAARRPRGRRDERQRLGRDRAITDLIRAGERVDPSRLADPDTPL